MISTRDRMLKQTDLTLTPESTRTHGCRFMCLIAVPQLYLALPLIEDEILDIYTKAIEDPLVMKDDAENHVLMGAHEHKVIDHAFRLLCNRVEYRGYQVGMIKNGRVTYWEWVAKREYQYALTRWKTSGPNEHFTVFDPKGVELYDPYSPPLNKLSIIDQLIYQIRRVI